MDFTETERAVLENQRRNIRSMIFHIRRNEMDVPYTKEEYPHAWKRLEQLEAMSNEELLREVEADYLLFDFTRCNLDGKLEFVRAGESQ